MSHLPRSQDRWPTGALSSDVSEATCGHWVYQSPFPCLFWLHPLGASIRPTGERQARGAPAAPQAPRQVRGTGFHPGAPSLVLPHLA